MGFITISAIVVAVVVIYVYSSHFGKIEGNHERWGQFGDYFGGVLNPIFSFLGLIAIVTTYWLQTRQLRQALSDNKTQTERAELAQFQSTFFQLLELHNKIVSDAVISNGLGGVIYGRDVYRLLQARIESLRHYDKDSSKKSAGELYESVYLKNEDLLAHYFRNLYHIIKFVDESNVREKQFYADLFRAQLSSSESALLFYNGLSKWGIKKAKPLIEKYRLLKTLPDRINLPDDMIAAYDKKAFKNNFE